MQEWTSESYSHVFRGSNSYSRTEVVNRTFLAALRIVNMLLNSYVPVVCVGETQTTTSLTLQRIGLGL